ncbi:L-2-hydroxyglutarate dehydrogenase, mitochondrial isoform X1 [Sabethes cyaneus]|uniref:L-2-hydroxyglutarate dehydrogenase, mitochondrial isoform X1 n=1 Tax=Sabethes cyaneus TaxID=53552 RepID=UPI00237EE63F|nr:L-2-hydroxyglutarate dehydrogenase, mitochondrial isoform X1 [Sabethes cyaneus]XP_053689307.1 L-2-hydroxyglutarate dehydrogenase, mitochondrial isoform X1 [Sabethes cyaneus]
MLPKTLNRSVYTVYSPAGHGVFNSAFRYFSQNVKRKYDVVVVGGGIVGTASAREILLRHPKLKVAVVEKEPKLAFHQSGHNSGVIHAGIYYKPGSLKAKLCVQGLNLSYKYFDEKNIPYKKVGKLIVATNDIEVTRLNDLYERSLANNVPDVKLVDAEGIKEIEPYCEGIKAIWSPHTGIVDWALVTQYYAKDFKNAGGDVYLNFEVSKFEETEDADYPTLLRSKTNDTVQSRYILTCGGLQSDKIAELTGCSPLPKVVPFRGEYLLLNPDKCHMVKGNIYPVPDPRFPFLGVHFTPRMDGKVWLGPNAVLAFKREGYSWSDFNLWECLDALRFPGFIKMGWKFMGAGFQEIAKSAFIPLQVKELQKFIPEIQEYDVQRGPAGVRAQALDNDGNLVDDFVFDHGKGESALSRNILHCRNAPSPGATSSLAIAKMIADKIESEFNI